MEPFLDQLARYIQQEELLKPEQPIGVACSGGVDSVVLAFALHRLQYPIQLWHCNFRLRGAEADADAAFVGSLAAKWSVPFQQTAFDTYTFAQTQKVSVQMAARTLRYQWFAALQAKTPSLAVALAHHADDQVETILFNLSKGGGLRSLRGISPRRDAYIRPLLWATKAEIETFAHAQGLAWREDASNQENEYHRNFLRNRAIPLLHEINPNLAHTVAQVAERLRFTEQAIAQQVEALAQACCQKRGEVLHIDLPLLMEKGGNPVILHEILRQYGFSYVQAKQLLSTTHSTGKRFYSASHCALLNRDLLIVQANNAVVSQVSHRIEEENRQIKVGEDVLHTRSIASHAFRLPTNQQIAALDANLLVFPLELRSWQAGDRFQPLGMRGSKLVSDFLTDLKLSVFQKENTKVVVSRNEIVWVVGWRINHRYRITPKTQRIFEMEIVSSENA